ncbi:hypothetical protein GLOIN_2v1846618 [Rhizophagus irregularis DAOM 181602=DAOM 197198]|nr:hypothetical protein GLOIN_2v1846618 [Rhizophagus irregularis DAOM 181602=DAOM 197198]
MSMDKSRTTNEEALDFVSKFNKIYFQTFTHHLSSFVQDGFLKDLFEKNPSVPKDKAQLLIQKFGKTANPCELHFTSSSYKYTTHHSFANIFYSAICCVQVLG